MPQRLGATIPFRKIPDFRVIPRVGFAEGLIVLLPAYNDHTSPGNPVELTTVAGVQNPLSGLDLTLFVRNPKGFGIVLLRFGVAGLH